MERILFYNGQVVTMEEELPAAEAVLVENGRIAKVGTNEEVLALKEEGDVLRDLGGRALLPGFIDPHSHLTGVASSLLMVDAKPSPAGHCDTKEILLEEFRKALAQGDWSSGEWLMGMGYDPSVFPDGKHITRLDLDTVSEEVPISCIHASGHMSVLNTKALKLLGYWGDFAVPEGGTVDRLPDGTPHGLVTELAYMAPAVQAKVKAPGADKVLANLEKACELYASYGITTAQDARILKGKYELLAEGGRRGLVTVDVVGQVAPEAADELLKKGEKAGPYTNHVRMGGYKLFLDGSPQAKTAWLSKPYYIPPEGYPEDYAGFPIYSDEEVTEHAKRCLVNDWQFNVHCNGDAACEQMIRCYARAVEETGMHKDLRPVMVHAQTVREDQLDRMKELGIVPTFFLDHIFYWGDWHYESVLGPERGERISPVRSALKRGMNYTMHQDAPVVAPNMLLAVHNAVHRRTQKGRVLGADQRLTPMEALKGVTVNGAYQVFEEKEKGTIREGKLADLVILGANPLTVPTEELKDIPVLETIKEGVTIYRKEQGQ